jgi:hypothetical protein
LPGFINITIPKLVTAGGSIAIFVLVYTQSPAGKAVIDKVIPPTGDPKATADTYLALLDAEKYPEAYIEGSAWMRDHYSSDVYFQLLGSQRKPLGSPAHRELAGEQAIDNPSGYPPGAYRIIIYKTDFTNSPDKNWSEAVGVGSENRKWKVYNYNMARIP